LDSPAWIPIARSATDLIVGWGCSREGGRPPVLPEPTTSFRQEKICGKCDAKVRWADGLRRKPGKPNAIRGMAPGLPPLGQTTRAVSCRKCGPRLRRSHWETTNGWGRLGRWADPREDEPQHHRGEAAAELEDGATDRNPPYRTPSGGILAGDRERAPAPWRRRACPGVMFRCGASDATGPNASDTKGEGLRERRAVGCRLDII